MPIPITLVPAASAPPALSQPAGRFSPDWELVAERLLDAKRGDWLRSPLAALPGKDYTAKANNMRIAMRHRKIELVQRRLGADLFYRVATEAEAKAQSKRGRKKAG